MLENHKKSLIRERPVSHERYLGEQNGRIISRPDWRLKVFQWSDQKILREESDKELET